MRANVRAVGLATGAVALLWTLAGGAQGQTGAGAERDIDRAFRVAYPQSAPSSNRPLAGVDLVRLGLPGLQPGARDEQPGDEGGITQSYADSSGRVRVVIQLSVMPDAMAARRVLDGSLHGVSTQLSRALDPLLGDLAWADDAGRGDSLVMATQANIAYTVQVLEGDAQPSGRLSASTVAGLLRTAMVPGSPQCPEVQLTLPPQISATAGGPLAVTLRGEGTYRLRAQGAYVARGSSGPTVRPLGPGTVQVQAIAVGPLGCVAQAQGHTLAQ